MRPRPFLLGAALSLPVLLSAQLGLEHRFIFPGGGDALAVHDMDGDGDGDILRAANSSLWLHHQVAPNNYWMSADLGAPGPVENIRFGDVNSDGTEDVLLALADQDAIAWIELGGPGYGPLQLFFSIEHPTDAQLADVDGDLDMDLLYVYDSLDMKLGWAENLGGGSFGAGQLIQAGLGPVTWVWSSPLNIADVDQDGDPDLATMKPTLRWLENDGLGSFTAHVIPGGLTPYELRVGDLDGDLLPDLLLATDDDVYRRMNAGGGTFAAEQVAMFAPGPGSIVNMALADRESDGDMDLFAWWIGGDIGIGDETVLCTNDGAGNFSYAGSFGYSNFAEPFCFGDLDGDVVIDVVAYSNDHLTVTLTAGGGPVDLASLPAPMSITAVGMDPVVGGGNYWSVVAEGPPPMRLVRHNNDGTGNIEHSPDVLFQGEAPIAHVQSADINGDGNEDLLATWVEPISGTTRRFFWLMNSGSDLDSASSIGPTWWAWNPSERVIPITRDMDMDGDLDVFWNNQSFHVCMNDGNGNFAPEQLYWFGGMFIPNAATLCDVDADGDPDPLWSHANMGGGGTDSLFWNANDGLGVPGPSQWLGGVPINAGEGGIYGTIGSPRFRGVDMDLDGAEDLVVFAGDSLAVMLNSGGAFTTASELSCSAWCLTVGDIDGDTYPDLVALRANGDVVAWLNLGDGSLGGELLIATAPLHTGKTGLSLADMNGDGRLDILTCSVDGSAAWLPNLFNATYRAEGEVWHDANGDAVHDVGEGPLPFIQLQCQPAFGFPMTDAAGAYEFALTPGTFTLSSNAPDALWMLTTAPPQYTVALTAIDPVSTGNDFGYTAAVDTTILEPVVVGDLGCNGWSQFLISLANLGTTTPDGTIALALDTALSFSFSTPPPDSVAGGMIYWSFIDLYYYSNMGISVLVQSPDTGFIGTVVNVTATVDVLDSLGNVVQTIMQAWGDTVECSYDPNFKEVAPAGLGSEGYIDIATDHLDYTIHFQNVGNAPAANVAIRDLLDADLDPTALTILGYSHTPSNVGIEPFGTLVFEFDGINLPDSGSDYHGSQGFVKFRIGLDGGLPHLSTIENCAAIHFDLNPAVITNTVTNTLVDCDLFSATISAQQEDVLLTIAGVQHQWFLNGDSIPGATNQFLLVTVQGSYTVEVTSIHGCVDMSDPFQVIFSGIRNEVQGRMIVVPNPASADFAIVSSEVIGASDRIELVDEQGRVLRSMKGTGATEVRFSRSGLQAGVYVLRIIGGHGQPLTAKVVLF